MTPRKHTYRATSLGKGRSPAKTASARINGTKGGRPPWLRYAAGGSRCAWTVLDRATGTTQPAPTMHAARRLARALNGHPPHVPTPAGEVAHPAPGPLLRWWLYYGDRRVVCWARSDADAAAKAVRTRGTAPDRVEPAPSLLATSRGPSGTLQTAPQRPPTRFPRAYRPSDPD